MVEDGFRRPKHGFEDIALFEAAVQRGAMALGGLPGEDLPRFVDPIFVAIHQDSGPTRSFEMAGRPKLSNVKATIEPVAEARAAALRHLEAWVLIE